MKLAGVLLVLAGAGYGAWSLRREAMAPVRLGRALLEDLSALRYQVCVLRRPLPELLAGALAESPAAPKFWTPLEKRLAEDRGATLAACWRRTALALPSPLAEALAPLGEALPAGGGRLDAAINETREELARYVREETARQAQQGRLTAALCLSGALLLILVLV